jgi:hypothetical protein
MKGLRMNKIRLLEILVAGLVLMLCPAQNMYASPVSDSQLGPAPGTYVIAHDQETVVLPFHFFDMNLMVNARMNGKDIKMLIDNGVMWDELLFYGSDLVDGLGLQYEGNVRVTGAGDDQSKGTDSLTAKGASLSFGDVTFHGQSSVITPKDSGWANFFPGIAGQVCGAFFKHFVVEFNFDKQTITLHKPGTFRYKGNGSSIVMRRDEGGGYKIPIQIVLDADADAIDDDLSIDLGGIDPVALVIGGKYDLQTASLPKVYLGHGASGEITGYREPLARVTIGGYEMKQVPAVFTESADGGNHTNKTVGLPLLMRFNLVFDYFNQTLYLEPNGHFDEPYEEV